MAGFALCCSVFSIAILFVFCADENGGTIYVPVANVCFLVYNSFREKKIFFLFFLLLLFQIHRFCCRRVVHVLFPYRILVCSADTQARGSIKLFSLFGNLENINIVISLYCNKKFRSQRYVCQSGCAHGAAAYVLFCFVRRKVERRKAGGRGVGGCQ